MVLKNKIRYRNMGHFDASYSLPVRIEQTRKQLSRIEFYINNTQDNKFDALFQMQCLRNQLALLECEVDRRNNGAECNH